MQLSRYIFLFLLTLFLSNELFAQKLLLNTDKPLYLSGEILWFSVKREVSAEPDNILYAELLDAAGRPALQAKLEMEPGGVGGSFYLPSTLASGSYKLRTYTRHFSQRTGGYAETQLQLINSIAAPVASLSSDSLQEAGEMMNNDSAEMSDLPPSVVRKIAVTTDAAEYQSRKQVALRIDGMPSGSMQRPQDFSVAVYLEDSLTDWAETRNYKPAFPKREGTAANPREIAGQVVQARISNRETGEPGENIGVYLSIPSAPTQLYVGRSTTDGLVSFEVDDYYGPGEVFLQPFMDQDSARWQIELLSPFYLSGTGSPNAATALILPANLAQTLTRRSIDMQAQNLYWADSLKQFVLPQYSDTLPFYGIPDQAYELDEYVRFVTMEEVLREYVTSIGVGVKGGLPFMRLFHLEDNIFVDDNLLVMLDGVPVRHYNRLFQYDPLKVKRLEIVQSMYIYGYQFLKGIIHFMTYDHIYNGYEMEPSVIARNYDGLQLKRKFFSPDYNNGNASLASKPDLRNTLYWEASVQLSPDQPLTFYTGDRKGRFRVEVKGLTAAGEEWSGTTSFVVE